jgi:hypothetical protein
MTLLPIQRLQGFGLLLSTAGLAALLGWSFISPVLDLRQAIADAQQRIDRFEASAKLASAAPDIDTSMVIAVDTTAEAHSLIVQRSLVDDARTTGLQMNQLSATPPRQMERGLVRLSYDLDVAGDLEHWTTFLKMLSERRPALFLDKVVLRSGPGPRADANLAMQISVSAYLLGQPKK